MRIELAGLNEAYHYLLLLAGIAFIFAGGWMVPQFYDTDFHFEEPA